MDLRIYFNGGQHNILHEYYTYEMHSFIADIGGYLVRKIQQCCIFTILHAVFSGFVLGCQCSHILRFGIADGKSSYEIYGKGSKIENICAKKINI